jgi:hypothetical protein
MPAAQVVMAAAQGALAAVAIDQELLFTDTYGASEENSRPAAGEPGIPAAEGR